MQLADYQQVAFMGCDLDGTRTHDSLIKSQVIFSYQYFSIFIIN